MDYIQTSDALSIAETDTYTLYLDGEQVARETVDLSLYTVHCDDENQVIYLIRR